MKKGPERTWLNIKKIINVKVDFKVQFVSKASLLDLETKHNFFFIYIKSPFFIK